MRPNDILPPDDDLRPLAADLEAIYDMPTPAGLAARIDAAVQRASGPVRMKGPGTMILRNRAAPQLQHDRDIAQPRGHRRGRGWWSGLAATAAMFAVVVLIAAVLHGGIGGSLPTHLAQVGGLKIVANIGPCAGAAAACNAKDPAARFDQEFEVLDQRFKDTLGVRNAGIVWKTDGQAYIFLPGTTDQAAARALLVQGQFVALDTGDRPLAAGFDVRTIYVLYAQAFSGEQIDASTVRVEMDKASGKPVVTFTLRGQARDQFAAFTRTHIGHYLTFTLDGIVLESAVIQAPITTGRIEMSGLPSMADAQRLALFLRSGALPLPLQVVSITVEAYSICAAPTGMVFPTVTPAPNGSSGGTSTTTGQPGGASASGPTICPPPTPSVSGAPTATAIPPQATNTAPPSVTPPPTPTASPSPTATAIPPRPTATP